MPSIFGASKWSAFAFGLAEDHKRSIRFHIIKFLPCLRCRLVAASATSSPTIIAIIAAIVKPNNNIFNFCHFFHPPKFSFRQFCIELPVASSHFPLVFIAASSLRFVRRSLVFLVFWQTTCHNGQYACKYLQLRI